MEFLEKDLYITYDEFEAYINGEGPQKESSFRTSGTQGKPKSLSILFSQEYKDFFLHSLFGWQENAGK